MISDFIEKLQNKSKPLRIFILWTSVAISMTIIFVLWGLSLKNTQSEIKTVSQLEVKELGSLSEAKNEIPSLWQSLKAAIIDISQSIKEESQSKEEQPEVKIESGEPQESDRVPPASLP